MSVGLSKLGALVSLVSEVLSYPLYTISVTFHDGEERGGRKYGTVDNVTARVPRSRFRD
jgi:hypothetical protein